MAVNSHNQLLCWIIAKLFSQSILWLTYQRQTPVTASFINNFRRDLKNSRLGMLFSFQLWVQYPFHLITFVIYFDQIQIKIVGFLIACFYFLFFYHAFLTAPHFSHLVSFSCSCFIISAHTYFCNNSNSNQLYATK